ncbi:mechanosensitive ion channel family protein [Patescibacteria group bacterium]|nr:mechanosensitive ion channel family protein [Patescibacteria group bacterium]
MQNYIITFFTSENGFWGTQFAGNSLRSYTIAIFALIASIFLFLIIQRFILVKLDKLAQKTQTDFDDVLIATFQKIKPQFYYLVALYVAFHFLTFPEIFSKLFDAAILIIVIIQILSASQTFIDYLFEKLAKKQKDAGSKSAMNTLAKVAKIILWSIGILLILSNLGIDITSLVAGLGIGGIAIAFALQNILADLFASFAIFFDKPFVPGDFIVVGEHSGTVEKIGIKSTRVRALQGEEIIISNKELTSARVQNFKRLKERRTTFTIGVTYDTPASKLKKIPGMIKAIIKEIDSTKFDRAHFKSFGDSALIFEIVYIIKSDDYTEFMDVQQKLNIGIHQSFNEAGIQMAFPTQTVHLISQS